MKNMSKLSFFVLTFLLIPFILFSQKSVEIKGIVTGSDINGPLPGVNVFEKGTVNGTITDMDGNFSIKLSGESGVLVISYVGYQQEEIPVGENNSYIEIQLKPETKDLDEVVVIGYGRAKKSDLTGSLVSISSDELENSRDMGIEQALQGKAAGVQITNNSGAPGAGLSVRIRGVGSLNSGMQPLYVVDGFIMGDQSFGKENSATPDNKVGISFLDPSEIESIEILKDASAAAIYGARGANGVVLITTKKGKSGKGVFNFDSYIGMQQLAKDPNIMNAEQYRAFSNEYNTNIGRPVYPGFEEGTELENTDWVDAVTRNAMIKNYKLSVSGGNETSTYLLSASYQNQEGIVYNSGYERFSARINGQHKVNEFITLGENFVFAKTMRNRVDEQGFGGGNILYNALTADPSAPVYDTAVPRMNAPGLPNWTYLERSPGSNNPVRAMETDDMTYGSYNYFGNVFADIKILKELTFHSRFGFNITDGLFQIFHPQYYINAFDQRSQTGFEYRTEKYINWDLENTLTYTNTFGEHDITVMGGFTAQKESFVDLRLNYDNFPYEEPFMLYPNVPDSDAALKSTESSPMEYSIASVLARVMYSYQDKYLFTASFRRDGSSKFGPSNRWGTFPSFSAGYKMSEEPFIKSIPAISFLKLRGGWGLLGNQAIPPYQYSTTLYSPGNNYPFGLNEELYFGFLPNGIANENIKWETTSQTNFGVDWGFFKNKVTLTIDYFNKHTYDLLMPLPAPAFTGIHNLERVGGGNKPTGYGNVAEINNNGLELAGGYKYRSNSGDFSIKLNANISFVNNKVLKLVDKDDEWYSNGFNGTNVSVTREGGTTAEFYGYVVEGLYQSYDDILNSPYQGPIDPHATDNSVEPNLRKYISPKE